MMELNGQLSTRRWLPSHVYADMNAATSRMRYLVSCHSSPGDPRLGPVRLGRRAPRQRSSLGHVGFSPLGNEVEPAR